MRHPAFRDSGEGWLGGSFLSAPLVYTTPDGGASWHAIQIASAGPGQFITSLALIPGGGVIVEAQGGALPSTAFVSSDHGATWHSLPELPTTQLDDLKFVDATHWWSSRDGVIYTTADAGSSWHEVAAHGFPPDWNFQIAGVIDADHAWWAMASAAKVTENGLALTSDGGAHWKMVKPPQPG
jgi:photosystem II stability/assembly factor-like uncharacterized protein